MKLLVGETRRVRILETDSRTGAAYPKVSGTIDPPKVGGPKDQPLAAKATVPPTKAGEPFLLDVQGLVPGTAIVEVPCSDKAGKVKGTLKIPVTVLADAAQAERRAKEAEAALEQMAALTAPAIDGFAYAEEPEPLPA